MIRVHPAIHAPVSGLESPADSDGVEQRDVSAIAEAYNRHQTVLCSFARRLLGNSPAAEDLVHDVFLLLPKLAHRVTEENLRSFLLGIAANRARHYTRAAARHRQLMERLAQEPRAGSVTPDEERERRVLAEALARGLEALPYRQRVAFVLAVVEGRDQDEVAEILRIPASTVRTRIFYARRKLRAYLAKEGVT